MYRTVIGKEKRRGALLLGSSQKPVKTHDFECYFCSELGNVALCTKKKRERVELVLDVRSKPMICTARILAATRKRLVGVRVITKVVGIPYRNLFGKAFKETAS